MPCVFTGVAGSPAGRERSGGLATCYASSGASGVPRRVKVERRRQGRQGARLCGLFEIRTLSGWGARYTEKKARREVSDSAVLGRGFVVSSGRGLGGALRPKSRTRESAAFSLGR